MTDRSNPRRRPPAPETWKNASGAQLDAAVLGLLLRGDFPPPAAAGLTVPAPPVLSIGPSGIGGPYQRELRPARHRA